MGSLKRRIKMAGADLVYRQTLRKQFGLSPSKSERRKLLVFAAMCVDDLVTGLKELTK